MSGFSFLALVVLICVNSVIAQNVTLAGGYHGVDVSSTITSSAASCFKSAGISFVIPRGYKSSGSVDTAVCTSIKNAHNAGISTSDAYMFPCPTCSKSAATQVSELVNHLNSDCKSAWSGRIWLDIEGSQYWHSSSSTNKAWYQDLKDACVKDAKCGVYSSSSQWSEIFGSTSYSYGSNLPLWYAHYDGSASFSDFKPFGGWSTPYAKQYQGTTTQCSTGVDKNWAATGTPSGGSCDNLGYYCGNDGLGKNANDLYYCSGSGATPSLHTACSFTCTTMPKGYDDKCENSGTCSKVNTGNYCGGDKISGDSKTLYRCESSKPAGAKYCANGCVTAPSGENDYCK